MACQHSYPREAQVGGGTFGFYDDVLARLIGWMLRALDVDRIGDAVGGASDHAPVSAVPLREEELVGCSRSRSGPMSGPSAMRLRSTRSTPGTPRTTARHPGRAAAADPP